MMNTIAERYKITKEAFKDSVCTAYEALDEEKNTPVTVKVLSEELNKSALERLLRFRKQIDSISAAAHPNLQAIYAHGEFQNHEYIVTEDVERVPNLVQYSREPGDIDIAVDILLQIASGLAAAHEQGVTHQGINSARILLYRNGGDRVTAKLADFGIPLLLDLAGIKDEGEVIGTFGYMSPEASGILRKPVDERSDLYSLGIVFYQLVTGRLPYEGKDTSTIIHQHIAQKPTPPKELNPAIPSVVERIILRLMAKDPLDRYQTVSGLITDLQEYQRRRIEGESLPDFEIARSDRAGELNFNTRLVGRKQELQRLQDLYGSSKESKGSFCVIHGEPGVGKTRLIEELRDPILGSGGVFACGKGYKADVATPYKAFSEIIEAYLERLRRLAKEEREPAIRRMKTSLGDLGAEVAKLAPGIAEFIGEPPELIQLDADKEKIRFLVTIANFILSLGAEEDPLVMVIDDVHWADQGSIELLERVAEQADACPVLIIAAYTDPDTPADHSLFKAIDKAREKNSSVQEILLLPFGVEHTTRIISEILSEPEDVVQPLSRELQERTQGNAFFILELLRSLVSQKIVFFKDNRYQFNLDLLRQAALPTDIVEMVIKRVNDVPSEIQQVLSHAAVMGQQVDLGMLSTLSGLEEVFVLGALEAGIKNQFLGRDNENVFFIHDRIREAFYDKLADEERTLLHSRVASEIEAENKDHLESVVFELAHHFAQAYTGHPEVEEKTLYYCLQAARKAQGTYAHDQAARLYDQAARILEKQGKKESGEYIDIQENLGSVYKTAGKFDEALEALEVCEQLIPKEDSLRRAEVLSKAGDTLWEKGEGDRAAELLREALKSLGVRLPRTMVGVLLGLLKESAIQMLHTLFPSLFVRKEYQDDQKKAVIVRIVIRIAYFYYFTEIIRCLHLGMKFVNMGERMGPSRVLSNIYAAHTVIWSGFPVAVRARRDANLAVKVAQDLRDRAAEGTAYSYFAVSTYSNRNAEEGYAHALKSIELLKGVGEYWDLGVALNFRDLGGMLVGKNLNEVLEDAEETITIARNANSLQMLGFGLYGKAYALALIGDERVRTEGIKAAQEAIEVLGKAQDRPNGLLARSFLGLAYDRAGMYDEAIQVVEEIGGLFWKHNNQAGWIHTLFPIGAQVYLDCIRRKPDLTEEERQEYLKRAKHFCRRALWRKLVFPYIRSHTDQVNGTCRWLSGNKKKAVEIWEKAIVHLRNHTKDTYRLASILLEEGSFLLEENRDDAEAREYLFEARDLFSQLGAKLDSQRVDQLLGVNTSDAEVLDSRQTLTLTRQLDSLLSVTKAIGSIFVLEELLDKVVHQAMQVTGAERGFLLLYDEQDGTLRQKVSLGIEEAEMAGKKFSFANCKISLALVQQVEKTQEGLFEGQDGAAFANIASELKEYQVKEALCVPLKAKDKPLGMIYLDNRMASGIFGKDEIEIMNSFAVQASISIENAYLVGNMVEQERLKQELELAKKIQTSLLPAEPKVPGYDVAAIMATADEVGGDYYDVINVGGFSWVVIGDVSGHGLPSGLVMMMVQTAINVALEQNAGVAPSSLLSAVNKTISKNMKNLGENKYMTITVLAVHESGLFSHAGLHQDMLVYRARTKEVERVETKGMWLGIMDDISDMVVDEDMRLEVGDTLLLYTDGVTEAVKDGASQEEKEKGEDMYGDERLAGVLSRLGGKPAGEIQAAILQELDAYRRPDDVTMVVARRTE